MAPNNQEEAGSSVSGLSSPPRSSPEKEMGDDAATRIVSAGGGEDAAAAAVDDAIPTMPPSQPPPPPQAQPQPSQPPQPPLRKKPGRKPKSYYAALALANANANSSNTTTNNNTNSGESASTTPPIDVPKVRRAGTRKPKDLKDPKENSNNNHPAPSRRKRHALPDTASNSASEGPAASGPPAATTTTTTDPSQNGKSEDIQRPINSFFTAPAANPQQQQQPHQHQPQLQPQPQPQLQYQQQQQQQQQQQPPPPPHQHHQQQQQQHPSPSSLRSSSGQNYDPIRSNFDPIRETLVSMPQPPPSHPHHPHYNHNPQGSPGQQPPPPPHALNRASASPSISSLVDPPHQVQTSPSIAAQSFFNQQQARLHQSDGHGSVPPSPPTNRLAPSAVLESSGPSKQQQQQPTHPATSMTPRRSDGPDALAAPGPALMVKRGSLGHGSTATSSAAASPKPPKVKEAKDVYPAPPPLPGSGLMQLGGIGDAPGDGTEFRAPTVVLNIPMQGEVNKIINFTRMAEERYGWDALHPRLAAQRDRLARVAAAGAALERNGSGRDSGDDMSLDSEAEGSNVEMGGMSDGRAGTDGGAKKIPRKRRMKEDEYDKDDGFVDDSELLWEEQAAAATDGFFVYSGPLIPEEKPVLDARADGAPKRGRGRGSRGGTSRSSSGRGGTVGINARTGLPLSGPGSRGGSTTRKPRITKADRARMEQEKLEREKMGSMASMPAGYSGMAQLASAANMGNTPMVFNQ